MNDMSTKTGYRVLARKYRPKSFDEMIGQDALVRTLSNAIETGRIAHAFILTGVRGVGKTTTARIIARALNCTGTDGQGGPTISPCGQCENCLSIAEDRHVDVIEMDAASRTGIDDIRELIDGVRYRPVSARYKVYIIDEVHMLSRQAFNGLLKTLEEPPEHVIFIFATTEIRKVPVTVLSRCQRFDLRRVEVDVLSDYFKNLSAKEEVEISDDAIGIVARAADGSVRDGLSLLDQAISMSSGAIDSDQIRDMLGLADRAAVFDLFDTLMKGDIASALTQFESMYRDGADPVVILQDMLDVTYWLTRIKVAPEIVNEPGVPETERKLGAAMATGLPMPVLTRTWQMLLKGLAETQNAPATAQAAEMTLIRLAYAANLPTPGDLVKKLETDAGAMVATPGAAGTTGAPPVAPKAPHTAEAATPASGPTLAAQTERIVMPLQTEPQAVSDTNLQNLPQSFLDVVRLFEEHREGILTKHMRHDVHLVHFEPGRIEFRPGEFAPSDLANKMGQLLSEWTDHRWIVSVSGEAGDATLAAQAKAREAFELNEAESHPLVSAVREHFPGAKVTRVSKHETLEDIVAASPDDDE